jgi:hypothetical protein
VAENQPFDSPIAMAVTWRPLAFVTSFDIR